jgi:hypothetical protein
MMVLRCCSGTYFARNVIILGQNMPISTSKMQNAKSCTTPDTWSCLVLPASAALAAGEPSSDRLLLGLLLPLLRVLSAAAENSSSRNPCWVSSEWGMLWPKMLPLLL